MLSSSFTPQTTFFGWRTPLYTASTWGNAIAPPSDLPTILPCGAQALLRSQLSKPGNRSPGRLRGCQWVTCVAMGLGAITLTFPWIWDLRTPPTRYQAAPPSRLLGGPFMERRFWAESGTIELCGSGVGATLPPFPKPYLCPLLVGDPPASLLNNSSLKYVGLLLHGFSPINTVRALYLWILHPWSQTTMIKTSVFNSQPQFPNCRSKIVFGVQLVKSADAKSQL